TIPGSGTESINVFNRVSSEAKDHEIGQQVLGTGNNVSIDNIDNRRLTEKHRRDTNNEGVTSPLKKIKTADRAENMDGCKENRMQSTSENSMISLETDDEIDYSNHDIDPNIESDLLEKQIPVQNHSKYPDQDSQDNIWLLPSRKPIDEVIRGPGNLHKSHPSCLGIIRIGSKIRKPEWIEQKDWNYLQTSIEYPNYKLTSNVENLVKELLETNSLMEYKQCVCKAKFKNEIDKEMEFVTDVFLWFTKNVFNPASAFRSKNKNEALLGSLMIHPMLQYLINATDRVIYVPGEIYLKASANQRLLRRNLKPDDDKPLGMKIDGSFHSPGEEGLEIGMVELSGGYLTSDLPRYLKDHVKGYWGCRDLLNDIVRKYNRGDYKIFRRLRSWFFHIHGLEVQIWVWIYPFQNPTERFSLVLFGSQLVGKIIMNWRMHLGFCEILEGLDDTLKILEELKKSHRRNSVFHSQSSKLMSHIGDAKSSPQKPIGKNSRFINLLMYHDYNDSDYEDPPSPSPSGCFY
ncbi:15589_t:CDS:2, partial [Funneliformis mosseae]